MPIINVYCYSLKIVFIGNFHPIIRSFHLTGCCEAIKDLYKILKVPKTATQKEIKKAYYEVCINFFCICRCLYAYHGITLFCYVAFALKKYLDKSRL